MSAYDQKSCIHCLDKAIALLDNLEQAVKDGDSRDIAYCANRAANYFRLAKMYLDLWNHPDSEERIRERELENYWSSNEPEVYDQFGRKILY